MPKPAAPQASAPLVRPGAQQGTLSSAVRPGVKPVRPGTLRPAGAPTPAGSPKGFQKPGQPGQSGLKSTARDVRPGTPAVGVPRQNIRPGMGSAAAGMSAAAMLAGLALNVGSAHPQIATDVSVLNSNLQDLGGRSTLQNLQAQVNELDANLNRATTLLESARSKGYVYQKDLDEIAYAAMDRWQAVRDQVLNSIPQQSAAFQNRLVSLNGQVARLNSVVGNPAAATPLLSSTSSQVNTYMSDLNQIEFEPAGQLCRYPIANFHAVLAPEPGALGAGAVGRGEVQAGRRRKPDHGCARPLGPGGRQRPRRHSLPHQQAPHL